MAVTPLDFDDKHVVALEVIGAPELTLAPDGLFMRSAAHTGPATKEQARSRVARDLVLKRRRGKNNWPTRSPRLRRWLKARTSSRPVSIRPEGGRDNYSGLESAALSVPC